MANSEWNPYPFGDKAPSAATDGFDSARTQAALQDDGQPSAPQDAAQRREGHRQTETSPPEHVLLRARSLTKKYGKVTALNGMSLDIPAGKIIGLLGPNGSGKTTFMKIAAGLLTPTGGTVTIGGEPIGVRTKAAVAYLPEQNSIPEVFRVRDAVGYFADFFADFDTARAWDMLRRLEIDGSYVVKNLSKGMKEKVQLVMVMARRASLYLLDEPISGVDPAAREYVLQTIVSNYAAGASVLISTHLIGDIEKYMDRFLIIREGEIFSEGTIEGLRAATGKTVDEYFREVFKC